MVRYESVQTPRKVFNALLVKTMKIVCLDNLVLHGIPPPQMKTPEGAIVLSGSSLDDVVLEDREESVEREDSEVEEEPIAAVSEEGNEELDRGCESPEMVEPSEEWDERNGTGADDDHGMDWIEPEHSSTIPETNEDSIPGALLQSARERSTEGLSTVEATDEMSDGLKEEVTSEDERLLLSNSEEDPSMLSDSHSLDEIKTDTKQGGGSENKEPSVEHMDSDPTQVELSQETIASEDESPLVLGSGLHRRLLDTDSEHSQAETVSSGPRVRGGSSAGVCIR